MDSQSSGIFTIPFLGMVVADKGELDWWIEVYPMEIVPGYTGELKEKNEVSTSTTDAFGKNTSVSVQKDRRIKCRWIPMFDTANRVTPPSVRAGETVAVICFGELDTYFWSSSVFPDSDLRKLENMYIHLSNKQGQGESSLDQGYYLGMDTYNKFIKLHTSNNDGEYTTYDLEFRTKDGTVKLWDGKNNYIELKSTDDHLTIFTNNQMTINTTNKVLINTKDTENNSSNSVVVNTKTATINADTSATVNTKTCNINADSSCTIKTQSATVNASASATVKTNYCRIDSGTCKIN